ncbi:MAG: PAS domain S-box protein [Desulfococcaceae bacterium]|jgi:PAS domain S-box-containing protein|nr:PAS domain S-box protein [Desulfococcaceae bacterium]
MDNARQQYVLVIDDDPANISLLTKLLSMSAYGVYSADNGPEGLKTASEKMPDLILLDVMMPGMDGHEVCRRLKENEKTKNIPVIFITGTGSENKGLRLGAVDHIRKPFSTSIIQARVKNHLELKQYRDYLERLVRERTRELEQANEHLQDEIRVRRRAEEELKKYQDHLEELVARRTAELRAANQRLEKEIQERRQAEEQVRKSEEKYRSVFENTGSAMLIVEEDGTVSMINAECEKLTGYSKAEIQGRRKWTEFIFAEDLEKMAAFRKRRLSGNLEIPSEYECRIIDAYGNIRDVFVKVDSIPGTCRTIASWIDITDRKRSEMALKENEAYLRTIMATIQTGVLIVDPRSREIFDANPWAAKMIGVKPEELPGRKYTRYVRCSCGDGNCEDNYIRSESCRKGENCNCVIRTEKGEHIHVRRSYARAGLKNREYLIQSFLDISDIIDLLKRQDINIDLSRNVLNLVNRVSPRYTKLKENIFLFFEGLITPCHKQGGDHYFMRNFRHKTIITLKDQSGHQVSCVLRSIITDLIHHAILTNYANLSFEEVISRLNYEICRSGTFSEDDFFTSINAEINHENLCMKYVSAGHPPFLLIRGHEIILLPDPGDPGSNIPIGILNEESYTAGEIQLQVGDRIIFYTDGLTEMPENNMDRTLKPGELAEIVRDILYKNPDLRVSDIMRELLAKVARVSGESVEPLSHNTSGDDITMLCLEIEDDREYNERILMPENTHDALRLISDLYRDILQVLEKSGFENPDTRIWSVLEEGILNAWKHGNKQDSGKKIRVRWRYGNDFHLRILDEGAGFSPECIADPTSFENLTKSSGRGLFMIHYFSSQVRWNRCGSEMITYFKKHPDPLADEQIQQAEKFMKLWESG